MLEWLIDRDSPALAGVPAAFAQDDLSSANLLWIRKVMLCIAIATGIGTWTLLLKSWLPLRFVRVGG